MVINLADVTIVGVLIFSVLIVRSGNANERLLDQLKDNEVDETTDRLIPSTRNDLQRNKRQTVTEDNSDIEITTTMLPLLFPLTIDESDDYDKPTIAPYSETSDQPMQSPTSAFQSFNDNDKQALAGLLISQNITDLYLPIDYNNLEIPKIHASGDSKAEPLNVTVYFSIRSISEIDEKNEKISLEMDIIVSWHDGAIFEHARNLSKIQMNEYDDSTDKPLLHEVTLDPTFLTKIWKPDIYIDSFVDGLKPDLLTSPARLVLGTWGSIVYSSRLTVKLDCNFNFEYYPADIQKCDVVMRSYSYNDTDLRLKWMKPEGVFLLDTSDDNFDVGVGDVRRYTLATTKSRLRDGTFQNETFEVLQFTVSARRKLSYQLLQTYIPSALYIAITWLCFMIPRRMIEARMAISMTTLLTLTAMFGSVRESTPVVSYIKAIDIWMASGIMFVFLVLLEFAILLWTESAKLEEQEMKRQEDIAIAQGEPQKTRKDDNPSIGHRIKKKLLAYFTVAINFVERFSFLVVLLIVVIFNVLYWSWLFINSGYFGWSVDPSHNAVENDHINKEVITNELDPFE